MRTKAQSDGFRQRHGKALRFLRGGRVDLAPEVRVAVLMAVAIMGEEWAAKMSALNMAEKHPELAIRNAEERKSCAIAIGLLRQIAGRLNQSFDRHRMEALENRFVPANEME